MWVLFVFVRFSGHFRNILLKKFSYFDQIIIKKFLISVNYSFSFAHMHYSFVFVRFDIRFLNKDA